METTKLYPSPFAERRYYHISRVPATRSKPPKLYKTKAEKKAMKRAHVRYLKMQQATTVPIPFAS